MPESTRSDQALQAVLAEFNALRQEIVDLSARRQTVLLFQITTAGALFSFALSGKGTTLFLLIVPVVTYLCYSRYLMMRVDINRIARYIEEELSPRTPDGLNWEKWNRSRHVIDVSSIPLPPTFVAFPGISALALAAVVPAIFKLFHTKYVGQGVALSSLWVVSAALTVFIGYQVWVNSIAPYIRKGR